MEALAKIPYQYEPWFWPPSFGPWVRTHRVHVLGFAMLVPLAAASVYYWTHSLRDSTGPAKSHVHTVLPTSHSQPIQELRRASGSSRFWAKRVVSTVFSPFRFAADAIGRAVTQSWKMELGSSSSIDRTSESNAVPGTSSTTAGASSANATDPTAPPATLPNQPSSIITSADQTSVTLFVGLITNTVVIQHPPPVVNVNQQIQALHVPAPTTVNVQSTGSLHALVSRRRPWRQSLQMRGPGYRDFSMSSPRFFKPSGPRIEIQFSYERGAYASLPFTFREYFKHDGGTGAQDLVASVFDNPVPFVDPQTGIPDGTVAASYECQPKQVVHRVHWDGHERAGISDVLKMACLMTPLTALVINSCSIPLRALLWILAENPSLETLEVREIAQVEQATPIDFPFPPDGRDPEGRTNLTSLTLTSSTPLDLPFGNIKFPRILFLSLRLRGDANDTPFDILENTFTKGSGVGAWRRTFRLRGDLDVGVLSRLRGSLDEAAVIFDYGIMDPRPKMMRAPVASAASVRPRRRGAIRNEG